MDVALLIPIKAFHVAKARLGTVLDADQRERLARWTALRVLDAAGELPVYVACDDEQVATWARDHGANVLWQPGKGLNPAVNDSLATLRASGRTHVVVAHADLPRPTALSAVVREGTVTLVPDRHRDGTNVLSFPLACGLEVAYGPGSFRRHLAAALALPTSVEVRRDVWLGLDIDTRADLAQPLVREVLPPWLRTSLDNPTPVRPS